MPHHYPLQGLAASRFMAWGMCASTGMCHNIGAPALLFEATAPFTNGRWFLSKAGMKDTTLYVVNGVLMLLSFFLLRVLFNIWLMIQRFYVQREAFGKLALAMQVTLAICYLINLVLQLAWFSKILKGAMALIAGSPKETKKQKKTK